jgi:hypothetical protein
MIPKKFPKFHVNNLCKSDEYEDGDKKTTSGWLKSLFLWKQDDGYLVIEPQDRKDYKKQIEKFRVLASIPKNTSIEEWEDQVTIAKQIKLLNKFCSKISKIKNNEEDLVNG